MVQKLYIENPYLKETIAKITLKNTEDSAIGLDRTIFYPGGGGQPADRGTISKITFSRIRRQEDDFFYQIESDDLNKLSVGDKVHLVLDWEFRYHVMRLHTSQHLLAAIMLEKHGAKLAGNYIYPGKSHVDFEMEKNLDKDEDLLDIQREVNALIIANLEVSSDLLPLEEAKKTLNPDRVRLNMLPKTITQVRVITIGSKDATACGGTHINSTSQIGNFIVKRFKSKGKRRKRFYYRVEK